MVYWNIIVGIGIVVVAAGLAVYYSMPSPVPPHTNRNNNNQRRRKSENEDSLNEQLTRKSKPGDKCICCTCTMSCPEEMRQMKCGHAMHKECFQDFLKVRSTCLICGKKVISEPNDACTICLEPMSAENMTYLNCEHALHAKCLAKYKECDYTTCPLCRKLL